MRVKIFSIESKSKRGFEKGDMHVVITIELITIVSSIFAFQPQLIRLKNLEVLFKVGGLLPLLSSSLL